MIDFTNDNLFVSMKRSMTAAVALLLLATTISCTKENTTPETVLGTTLELCASGTEIPALYSHGQNEVELAFTLSATCQEYEYDLTISNPEVISADVVMESDGRSGKVLVKSLGEISGSFTVSLTISEKGEYIKTNWSNTLNWTLEAARLEVYANTEDTVAYYGGYYEIRIDSNLEYDVLIDDSCKDWAEIKRLEDGKAGILILSSHDKENERKICVNVIDKAGFIKREVVWMQDKEPAEGGYTDVVIIIFIPS